MNKLEINTKKPIIKTEDSLYGLFFEDINRSGDGGLYPELLRNRTFDDTICPEDLKRKEKDFVNETGWVFEYQQGEGLKRWKEKVEETTIPAWYGENAEIKLSTDDTLNDKRAVALEVNFKKGGKIYNIGFSGVPVREAEAYKLYFFAKTEKELDITVSLDEDGQVLSSKKVYLRGNGYIRYDYTLIPNKTTKKARLVITSLEEGKVKLGFISLMPEDTYHGHGLRKDLCEMLEGIHPSFLRFPGGCIVEGFSKSTVQRFKRMVGPVWERPGVLNLWSYRSTEGLGFHEYLQLCEDMKVDPLYVCNCGMTCQARNCILLDEKEVDDLLDDVMCAMEYAMGDGSTAWGAYRAAMGHPEPFKIKYLEIGNENNGPDYELRYEKFRKVISDKYPELIIVANTHVEKSGYKLDIADEHFYDKTEWFAENTDYYDKYDRTGPGIFVGEFAVVAGKIRTLYAALGEAMFMIGMERNQDIVKLAAYAPLFENVNYAAWEPNFIAFDGLDHYAIPSYYVWRMFAGNKGKYVLESAQESEVVYAPYLKGGPCLLCGNQVTYKNPVWKNEKAKPVHKMFGDVHMAEGAFITVTAEAGPEAESAKRFDMDNTVFITMSEDETSREGAFEIEFLVEEGKELGMGMFATPYGPARNSEDSPWNLFSVQPIRWSVLNGESKLISGIGFRKFEMTKPVQVDLSVGEYHKFKMESDGKKVKCFIDERFIMETELPHYDEIQTIALDDQEQIIVKIVNIADKDSDLEITMDCDVKSEYEVGILTGDPMDKNTMEQPEKIVEHWSKREGAGKTFTYSVPANSVSVLKLKK